MSARPVAPLLAAFERYGDTSAVVWRGTAYSHAWISKRVAEISEQLDARDDVKPGTMVALHSEGSPTGIAALLARLEFGCIVSPLSAEFALQQDELHDVARVDMKIAVEDEALAFTAIGHGSDHALFDQLRAAGVPGLVLFSSGSTGKSKAVVHDGARLLAKYHTPRRATVTIPFMLFDHIGGVNTVLHVLSSGGTVVVAEERTPDAICRLIEEHRVQVVPTSPTFVNLLLMSDYHKFDLSSLEVLAYGAERMPEGTLARLAEAFPNVTLIQNYGLSEVGIMRTKSEASDSLWVKLGGDGFETRVRGGLLEIKAATAMVGYLNESSPFTDDGWLRTGDRVEVKGEYFQILGRVSDIIIVGGEKVYPSEIEDLIAQMPGVLEVVVSGEVNAITGHTVRAQVRLTTEESRTAFRIRMNDFLDGKLPSYKIPARVKLAKEPLHNARGKKTRR